jgi:hypothetical protein
MVLQKAKYAATPTVDEPGPAPGILVADHSSVTQQEKSMAGKRAKRVARRPKAKRAAKKTGRKWSAGVTRRSDAMDLESGVFKKSSARQIALSLKRSVQSSDRRKSPPFRSAMSMLNFEINRAGRNLPAPRLRVLNQAKVELRKVFGRPIEGR